MDLSKHSDVEIEILLLGKWRFNTPAEKITVEFKDDMTYVQTRVQMLLFSKPKELVTGNQFTGVWYVSKKKLYFNVRTMPNSFLNLQIPLAFKLSFGDLIVTLLSVFIPEDYEVMRINRSKFLLKDNDQHIVGFKISSPPPVYNNIPRT